LFYILLLDCGTLPTLDNGAYVLVGPSNTTYGAPASVQCNTGYNSSIDAITCTENGTWSTTLCLAVGECDFHTFHIYSAHYDGVAHSDKYKILYLCRLFSHQVLCVNY